MTALARRLRVVRSNPKPKARKPGTWGPLSAPIFAAENVALAFWLSRCTPDLRRDFQLTDLRALARAIRCN